jgi:hypothetical protein
MYAKQSIDPSLRRLADAAECLIVRTPKSRATKAAARLVYGYGALLLNLITGKLYPQQQSAEIKALLALSLHLKLDTP